MAGPKSVAGKLAWMSNCIQIAVQASDNAKTTAECTLQVVFKNDLNKYKLVSNCHLRFPYFMSALSVLGKF